MSRVWLLVTVVFLSLAMGNHAEAESNHSQEELWRYRVQLGSGWKDGYVLRTTGRWVIPPQFDYAFGFEKNGLATVYVNKRFGLINCSGEVVAKPQFKFIAPFKDGVAKVEGSDGWGFINEKGEAINASPLTVNYGFFSEGMARFQANGKTGFVDKKFRVKIEPQYERALDFEDGVASVMRDGKWGVIDKNGRTIIEPKYDNRIEFREGLASVKIGEKWGCINKSGAMVIEPKFDSDLWFTEGMSRIRVNGKMGFVDAKGQWVIDPIFEATSSFQQGVVAVKINGKWGLIGKDRRVIIEPEYDEISSFKGINIACKNKKYGLFDNTGKVIAPLVYDRISVENNMTEKSISIRVREGDKAGYLNLNGQWLTKLSTAFKSDGLMFQKSKIVMVGNYFYDINGNKMNHYINHMNDGNEFLKQYQYDEAIRSFQAALGINPTDEAALLGIDQAEKLKAAGVTRTETSNSATIERIVVGNADSELLPAGVTAFDGSEVTGEERQAIITLAALINAGNAKDVNAVKAINVRLKDVADEKLARLLSQEKRKLHLVKIVAAAEDVITATVLSSNNVVIPGSIGVNIRHDSWVVKLKYVDGMWRVISVETNRNINIMEQVIAEGEDHKRYGVDDLCKWNGINVE